jgi:hypothetical protein
MDLKTWRWRHGDVDMEMETWKHVDKNSVVELEPELELQGAKTSGRSRYTEVLKKKRH